MNLSNGWRGFYVEKLFVAGWNSLHASFFTPKGERGTCLNCSKKYRLELPATSRKKYWQRAPRGLTFFLEVSMATERLSIALVEERCRSLILCPTSPFPPPLLLAGRYSQAQNGTKSPWIMGFFLIVRLCLSENRGVIQLMSPEPGYSVKGTYIKKVSSRVKNPN